MSPMMRKFSPIAVLTTAALFSVGAWGQMWNLNPKAIEIAQLPTFCWTQMGVPNANGPAYNFPRDCGPALNHYCPGLIKLIRAKKATKKGDRARNLLDADLDVRYTERGIQKYPSCSIRPHVEATKIEVRSLMGMYNVQRPKKIEP